MPKTRLTKRARDICSFVGANVRSTRRKRALTQEALAERAGVDIRSVQAIEAGESNLGVAVLVDLADALRVDPAALLRPAPKEPRKLGRPTSKRDS